MWSQSDLAKNKLSASCMLRSSTSIFLFTGIVRIQGQEDVRASVKKLFLACCSTLLYYTIHKIHIAELTHPLGVDSLSYTSQGWWQKWLLCSFILVPHALSLSLSHLSLHISFFLGHKEFNVSPRLSVDLDEVVAHLAWCVRTTLAWKSAPVLMDGVHVSLRCVLFNMRSC